MKIDITPTAKLAISVERQQQIIDGINAALVINPRQSFCLTGKPGSGKTYIMKALRDAAKSEQRGMAFVGDVQTLAEWHVRNHTNVMSNERIVLLESAENIQELAKINAHIDKKNVQAMLDCTSRFGVNLIPMRSLHIYLDEFDSQPSTTDFTQGNFQMFINRVYENTGRKRAGNDSDFVQFVCAMNRSMAEFKLNSSLHIYRRVLEMCVIVDFDRATITSPIAPVTPEVNKVQERFDREIEEVLK